MEFKVTEEAKVRIESTRKEGEFVRISLISGGCHGFSYKFALEKSLEEDDYTIKSGDGSVIVAIKNKFAEKLQNSILDFKKTISASYFVIESSNFETKCGCGTSFSLKS
jgi:iron-sulfur cluster assembly accessory protein